MYNWWCHTCQDWNYKLDFGFLKTTMKSASLFCRNPRSCSTSWDLNQWQINPEGRYNRSRKYTLVASYCGLCHKKLCTSIFNRGTIWPANGRHKGTAVHFSDAKKNAHTSQTQALWFFLQHMCIFTIIHYNEGLRNDFNGLYVVLSVFASRMRRSKQTIPVTVTQHHPKPWWEWWGNVSNNNMKGGQSACPLSHCFPSNRKYISLWRTDKLWPRLADTSIHPVTLLTQMYMSQSIRPLFSCVSTPAEEPTIHMPQTAEPRGIFCSSALSACILDTFLHHVINKGLLLPFLLL